MLTSSPYNQNRGKSCSCVRCSSPKKSLATNKLDNHTFHPIIKPTIKQWPTVVAFHIRAGLGCKIAPISVQQMQCKIWWRCLSILRLKTLFLASPVDTRRMPTWETIIDVHSPNAGYLRQTKDEIILAG
jgi:hypothetical protein